MITPFRIELVLQAATAIAHHERTEGNVSIHRRCATVQPDGSVERVPVISGACMRNALRRGGSFALLDVADMLEPNRLSESAGRLLFNGGKMNGSDSNTIKLDDYRKLVDTLPHLKLLGGCTNRIIPGRIQVDDAVLVCEESRGQWPTWLASWLESEGSVVDTMASRVCFEQRVRGDAFTAPEMRRLLTDGANEEIDDRLRRIESGQAKPGEKSTDSLPREFETIIKGSLFYWGVSGTLDSDFDLDVLMVMLKAGLEIAATHGVGGKKNDGFGKLVPRAIYRIHKRRWRDLGKQLEAPAPGAIVPVVAQTTALDLERRDAPIGSAFVEHVAARAEAIRELLAKVVA